MTESQQPPTALLVDERRAGQLLSVSPRTVFSLSKQGLIRFVKIGSRKLYPVAELQRFIAEQQRLCSGTPTV